MTAAAVVTRTRPARARSRGCEAGRATSLPGAEPTSAHAGPRAGPEPTLFDDLGGEPTLEDLVSGVWEGLAVHHRVACPVCGGEMVAAFGAHAHPSEGRCRDCGTVLV